MGTGEILEHKRASQWSDEGTYIEPADGENVRVPRLEVDDATTFIDKDGSNNMTFEDAVTGSKTLAEVADKSHASLTGVTADQHHTRSHDHSLAADGTPIAVAGVPNLDVAKITTGRFGMARMPDGPADKLLISQGAGLDPVYADPDVSDRAARILGQLTDGTAVIVPAKAGQLPTGLTTAGNLKQAIQETAIMMPFDFQAQLRALHASTTTALEANASWTSTSQEILNFGRITGTVFANVAGTIYVEQSPDNTNWDVVDSWSVTANAGLGFSVELVARYVRVRFLNGAEAQTTFRLFSWKRVMS